jgi:hypothetical protein
MHVDWFVYRPKPCQSPHRPRHHARNSAWLSFIAQFYLFSIRTPLIGLFIVIGIITNALTLALTALTGIAEQPLYLLTLIEYIMVFAAIINIIKHELKTI